MDSVLPADPVAPSRAVYTVTPVSWGLSVLRLTIRVMREFFMAGELKLSYLDFGGPGQHYDEPY